MQGIEKLREMLAGDKAIQRRFRTAIARLDAIAGVEGIKGDTDAVRWAKFYGTLELASTEKGWNGHELGGEGMILLAFLRAYGANPEEWPDWATDGDVEPLEDFRKGCAIAESVADRAKGKL